VDAAGHAPDAGPTGLPAFIARVRSVLDLADLTHPDGLDHADGLLTEGYARALSLERSCLRLREQAADLAARVDEPDAAQQLRTLAPTLRSAEKDLLELRSALADLRTRLGMARPAAGEQTAS
jgi:hypothetical protein